MAAIRAVYGLASRILALEKRLPGLLDDWLASLEDEATHREIIRLRAPREAPELTLTRLAARAWVARVRVVALARLGSRKRRRA